MNQKLNEPNFYRVSAVAGGVWIRPNKNRKLLALIHYGAENVYICSSKDQTYSAGKTLSYGVEWCQDHFNAQGSFFLKTQTNAVEVEVEEVLQNTS